ncbi:hypothetical protein PV368_33715 [Streptomyces sp. ME02-6979A]|uniref:hypothetical protein n=1 Tax=Streptomyces TaxID=1883 RepID=UPI0029AB53AD|nr:hypothetical protein [Streptomyces sp. ME02-6979A]MDX3350359.1 hypothetical protein [Streptomyces sp. ME02-6979A]
MANPMSEILSAQSWRITSGSPSAEEVAAVAVVLSAAMAAEAARAAEDERERSGERRRAGVRWLPSAARRRAATSWASPASPSWRNAA